jgi:hypothetical protein
MHASTVYSFQSSFRYCTFTKMKGLIRGNKTNWVGTGDSPHHNSAVVATQGSKRVGVGDGRSGLEGAAARWRRRARRLED